MRVRKSAQCTHRAKKVVVPAKFVIRVYVMIHSVRPEDDTLNAGWIEPMRVIETLSDLVFVVENPKAMQRATVYAQHIVRYPALRSAEEVSGELLDYVEYLNNSMQLIKALHNKRMIDGE